MVVLWKDYGAARIELGPLDGPAMEDLLLAVLGGPIDTVSLRQIAERSLGDPLFLHELVIGALDNGSLREESGIWRLRGPLQPTARLVELVTTRLGNLSDAERHALELTALGEPLAQPALDQLADSELPLRRSRTGVFSPAAWTAVVCRSVSRIPSTAMSCAPASVPRRQRVLAQELAEAAGGRRQDDTLLRAQLQLVGGDGSTDLLVAGAKAARERRDYVLAERLARAAMENGEGFEARLLAAEAAYMSGRHEQAARELHALAGDATDHRGAGSGVPPPLRPRPALRGTRRRRRPRRLRRGAGRGLGGRTLGAAALPRRAIPRPDGRPPRGRSPPGRPTGCRAPACIRCWAGAWPGPAAWTRRWPSSFRPLVPPSARARPSSPSRGARSRIMPSP